MSPTECADNSCGLVDQKELFSRFEQEFIARDFVKLKNALHLAVQEDACSVWDAISWALLCPDKFHDLDSDASSFLTEYIDSVFNELSYKEFLLLILEVMEQSQDTSCTLLSLRFLSRCIKGVGLSNIESVMPAFTAMREKVGEVAMIVFDEETDHSQKNVLVPLLSGVGKLFLDVFTSANSCCTEKAYIDEFFYYFSEPLWFIDVSESNSNTFIPFISAFQTYVGGIYSACRDLHFKVTYGVEKKCDISEHFDSRLPAYLCILNFCLDKSIVCDSWPRILSADFNINLFATLCAVFMGDLVSKISENMPTTLTQKRIICQLEKRILVLFSQERCKLPSCWWGPLPISLFENLQFICKLPISSQDLPPETKMAVECIECLLGASTITARCRLFTNLFKNLKASYHCGLRAHAITLFKNFLHDSWLKASQTGLPSLYSGEKQLNEDEMCIPIERRYLLPMCKDIFRFPLAECKESLLDQFSWLMAALNFILYVNIRAKNMDAILCDPAVAGLTTDVLQAVNMIDEEDRSCLKSSFINNINTELRQLIDRYSRAEKEHLESPDPKTLAPGAPSLEECRLTLLKLNLFSNTLGRLQEFQLV